MPDLLTLQSNLKLLKFKDFSEEDPYVLKSITSTELYQKRNSIDLQFEKRADDLQRMFKLLKDKPGLKFIAKLGVLSVLEYEDKPLKVAGKVLKNVAGTLAGILAQTSLNGTGFHFSVDAITGNLYVKASSFKKGKIVYNDNKVNRSGEINQGLPPSFKSVHSKPNSEFAPVNNSDISNLSDVFNLLSSAGSLAGLSSNTSGQIIRQLQSEDKLKQTIKTNLNYSGEIGSGLYSYKNSKSDTPIRVEGDIRNPTYFTDTVEAAERDLIQNSQIFNNETNDFGGRPSEFSTYSTVPPVIPATVSKLNANKNNELYKNKPATESKDRSLSKIKEYLGRSFPSKNLTKDLHIFSVPRSNTKSVTYAGTVDGTDKINSGDIISTEYDQPAVQSDFIPFEFGIIEPGIGWVDRLYFRAYLEDLSDSFSADWNPTKYVGRGDSVYIYNGFKRDINLGFKIAASSREELVPLYRKLNFLAGTTAPSYDTGGFMRGVLARLTVGDYFSDIPGFFPSVSTTWQTNYPWDLARGIAGIEDIIDKNGQCLPHVLDVKVTFIPIHTFIPAYRKPFIGSKNILGELEVPDLYTVLVRNDNNNTEEVQDSSTTSTGTAGTTEASSILNPGNTQSSTTGNIPSYIKPVDVTQQTYVNRQVQSKINAIKNIGNFGSGTTLQR